MRFISWEGLNFENTPSQLCAMCRARKKKKSINIEVCGCARKAAICEKFKGYENIFLAPLPHNTEKGQGDLTGIGIKTVFSKIRTFIDIILYLAHSPDVQHKLLDFLHNDILTTVPP